MNKDHIDLDDIKDTNLKDKAKSIFGRFDEDNSGSLEKKNRKGHNEIKNLFDTLIDVAQSENGQDAQVLEQKEIQAFLQADEATKNIDDNSFISIINELFGINLGSKKDPKGTIKSTSTFNKSVKVDDLVGDNENFSKIAAKFNTTEDGYLDNEELAQLWNELTSTARNNELSNGEAKKILKKYGLDKEGITEEDLYNFLNKIAQMNENVESSTVTEEEGVQILTIHNKE